MFSRPLILPAAGLLIVWCLGLSFRADARQTKTNGDVRPVFADTIHRLDVENGDADALLRVLEAHTRMPGTVERRSRVVFVAGVLRAGKVVGYRVSDPVAVIPGDHVTLVSAGGTSIASPWQAFTRTDREALVRAVRDAFGTPFISFENPIISFDDPALGFDDPALGFDDPALGIKALADALRGALGEDAYALVLFTMPDAAADDRAALQYGATAVPFVPAAAR